MNKIVLISGASSGIGLETAKYLSKLNYTVIGLSRSYPKVSYDFDYVLCDITDESAIKKTIEVIYDKYKKIDVLINSAGMGISGAIENTPLDEVKKIFNVNVYGQFLLTKHALVLIRNSSNGKIINISSIASEIALPFQGFYSMSKASIDAFTKALRIELKPFNIQVMALLPGDIKTDFTKNRTKPFKVDNDLYGERVQRSINKMELDEANGMAPIKIAKTIHKYIKRKNLPITKTVGLSYKLIRFLNKFLPEKIVLFFVRKLYG
ncbi:MAG: SDR family NAD(P)-dependent oxidoreductase [Candidatus Izimaplasma sp.]|nr:SDR family NAD(P)-dependent oxidoreductase [Candidatus Izimaplasma bacterium]